MIMTYFTERPYREVAEDEVFKNQAFFGERIQQVLRS